MQLHHIKPTHKLKKRRRIARGGKRGGYSGRGIKGQKSRAGAKIRPAIRDLMMKIPKQRGRAKHAFKSLAAKPAIFNLGDIDKKFDSGELVNPASLVKKNIISGGFIQGRKRGASKIKILGRGGISKKLVFQDILLSKSTRDKIIKADGIIK